MALINNHMKVHETAHSIDEELARNRANAGH
jgi:hypothetical protein